MQRTWKDSEDCEDKNSNTDANKIVSENVWIYFIVVQDLRQHCGRHWCREKGWHCQLEHMQLNLDISFTSKRGKRVQLVATAIVSCLLLATARLSVRDQQVGTEVALDFV